MKIACWECIECGRYIAEGAELKDGTRCRCGGMLEPRALKDVADTANGKRNSNRQFVAGVEIMGFKPFKRMANVIGEFALDERIPESIRMDYMNRIISSRM